MRIKTCLLVVCVAFRLAAWAQELPAAQETTPSVADAARSARERTNSIPPSGKVLTNDDIPSKSADPGLPPSIGDAEVRAALKRRLSKVFYFDFGSFVEALDNRTRMAQASRPEMALFALPVLFDNFRIDDLNIVTRDRSAAFAGRAQWDAEITEVSAELRDALNEAVPKLRRVLEENKAVLVHRDSPPTDFAPIEAVRAKLVDELMPAERSALRAYLLIEDGNTRLASYFASSQGRPALAQHREGLAAEADQILAAHLSTLNWSEQNEKKARGQYQCNPNSDIVRSFYEYRKYAYRLRIVGCTATQYQAFLDAPVTDGSQGHGLCVDETGVVRISADGTTDQCLARGTPQH